MKQENNTAEDNKGAKAPETTKDTVAADTTSVTDKIKNGLSGGRKFEIPKHYWFIGGIVIGIGIGCLWCNNTKKG